MRIGQISQGSSIKLKSKRNIENFESNKGFSDFLHQEGKRHSIEYLNKLLNEIDEQGEKLTKTKKLKDLEAYKRAIKKFMEEVINGALALEERFGFDSRGRQKRYKIIKEIDQRLIELTDGIIEKEGKQLNILDQIGEIRGLLVNLYY
ncbi:hypothetical protein BHF71_05055 [Vulcanibacillus modesticaldus]|uniref:DUF327 domain-containing protein n=1 Tax=Vulcanibacillus modesticaldus TaxID=337097 RepID=A0A1D2YXE3_9BACI|nr:YaaR family protein [Vulcanibacillus modesticaldus]OEG00276.1 hypothetical protein BHF71_05055 [Vulcanibacillus modesticaldus]